jgi:3-deoxy-D-manno-octulosonic-acid transferase
MSDLLAADAIVQVKDESELNVAVQKFFNEYHSEYACNLGNRAKAAVERRRGATDRCAKDILSFLV